MDLILDIFEESTFVKNKTANEFPEEIKLISSATSLYYEGFKYAKPIEDPTLALTRMGLVSQNFNTLNLATKATYYGYYLQSMILLRNVYENWLAFWYLAKYPEEVHKWVDPRWDTRPPKAETMRNKIDHPSDDTKSKLYNFYRELNRFSHTDPVAVLSLIRIVDKKPGIRVGVEFSKDNFLACVYALSLWNGNMLDAISCWIPDDSEWSSKYQVIMENLLLFLNWYKDSQKCINGSPDVKLREKTIDLSFNYTKL